MKRCTLWWPGQYANHYLLMEGPSPEENISLSFAISVQAQSQIIDYRVLWSLYQSCLLFFFLLRGCWLLDNQDSSKEEILIFFMFQNMCLQDQTLWLLLSRVSPGMIIKVYLWLTYCQSLWLDPNQRYFPLHPTRRIAVGQDLKRNHAVNMTWI